MDGRGVVVEFDFAAMDGAELLFKTTKKFLKDLDRIALDNDSPSVHTSSRTRH